MRPRLLCVLVAAAALACGEMSDEHRARRLGADRLGVSPDEVRVTERSELSTTSHRVLRVTARGAREITIILGPGGPYDRTQKDAFDRLAAAVGLARGPDRLGAARVAGWFGALGGGGACGEPLADATPAPTLAPHPDGGFRLDYAFARDGRVLRCAVELGPDGRVRRASADRPPLARSR